MQNIDFEYYNKKYNFNFEYIDYNDLDKVYDELVHIYDAKISAEYHSSQKLRLDTEHTNLWYMIEKIGKYLEQQKNEIEIEF